jgi:hypothetical protein
MPDFSYLLSQVILGDRRVVKCDDDDDDDDDDDGQREYKQQH